MRSSQQQSLKSLFMYKNWECKRCHSFKTHQKYKISLINYHSRWCWCPSSLFSLYFYSHWTASRVNVCGMLFWRYTLVLRVYSACILSRQMFWEVNAHPNNLPKILSGSWYINTHLLCPFNRVIHRDCFTVSKSPSGKLNSNSSPWPLA